MNTATLPNVTFDPALLELLNPCAASWINSTSALYNCTIVDVNASVSGIKINVNQSNDLAGNTVTANVSYSMFDIDQQEPTSSIDRPINSMYYNTSDIDFNFSLSDQDSCWYSLNGGANTPLPGCANTTLNSLTSGNYSLVLFVNDSVNNIVNDSVSFTVDLTGPGITIDIPAIPEGAKVSYGSSFWINITATEDLSEANITWDGSIEESMSNSGDLTKWWFEKTNLAVGAHTYQISVWDLSYNMNITSVYNFTVTDTIAPNVTLYYPEDNNNDGGSGGGGGGSSGSAYVPSSTNTIMTNPSVSYSYVFLENGTRIINITHSQIPLYAMALTTNEATYNVRFKITAVVIIVLAILVLLLYSFYVVKNKK